MVILNNRQSRNRRRAQGPLDVLILYHKYVTLFFVALFAWWYLSLLWYSGNDIITAGSKNSILDANFDEAQQPSLNHKKTVPVIAQETKSLLNNNDNNNDDNDLQQQKINKVKKGTIAYAWTLAKCSDFQTNPDGLIDAALVLRHSIYLNSFENPNSTSLYGHHMLVFVHPDAASCCKILEQAGYQTLILPEPIEQKKIIGNYYRSKVHREWCCGTKEFLKLYAYTLTEFDIVVHLDVDFAFYQPLDPLFDVMLMNRNSTNRQLRQQLESKVFKAFPETTFPDDVEAYLIRDYQQTYPGQTPLFQAGFMVVKPNVPVFHELKSIILKGDYVEGWKNNSGWGGLGYGGLVGAMAMQGLIAYYYDIIRPNVSVELNMCRYNHMGGDIFYRNVPNFNSKKKNWIGKCRNGRAQCEDCQATTMDKIQSVHYTNCRKPWNCIGITWEKGQDKKFMGIDERNTNYEHCMVLLKQWHTIRANLEHEIYIQSNYNTTIVQEMQIGSYKQNVFLGHCHDNGQPNYIPLQHRHLIQNIYPKQVPIHHDLNATITNKALIAEKH